jgi:Glycosyl hydrolase family 26
MRLRSLGVVAISCAIAVAAAGAAQFSGGTSKRPGGPLVPVRGVLLGGYSNPVASNWWTKREVLSRERLLGRRYAIDAHVAAFARGGGGPARGMTAELRWDAAYGRIPMLSFDGPTRPFPGLDRIASGAADRQLRAWARALKKVGRPLFLRPWWEMNTSWFPWAGRRGGSPATYVRAWRRMRTIFRREGAGNVVWVWCPNVTDAQSEGPAHHWAAYYPGDAYVDWVGIDGYNWGGAAWKSFRTRFGAAHGVYADYARRKPIMIAEYGSAETGGDKSAWYRDAAAVIPRRFPSIAALVAWDASDPRANFRIDSSPGAVAGYRALAHDRYFSARG